MLALLTSVRATEHPVFPADRETDAPSCRQGLEEKYANNRKRRRLVYALRRRKSAGGFKGCWDRISNDVRRAPCAVLCSTIGMLLV
jgi:hypothetical protein